MNPAYPQNAYPGYRPNTQPPPGMPMMDPNIAQMAQQRYMQQHQQQLAAMHAAGMIPGTGFTSAGGPSQGQAQGQGQGGMRMPPGMPMQGMPMGMGMNMGQGQGQGPAPGMGMGMGMNPGMGMGMPMGMGGGPGMGMGGIPGQGQGGPSSIPQQMHHAPQPPKQKKKPGPQPKHQPSPASQMIQNRAPPTSAEQYMKNAMHPPSAGPEVEPWADALDELDPRELAMNRFRSRHEMLSEVFGPEPIKSIPLGDGDAWTGLGMDGETLEAKVAALEAENDDLESNMDERLSSWTQQLASLESTETPTSPAAVTA